MDFFEIPGTIRASFSIYNTKEEVVEVLIELVTDETTAKSGKTKCRLWAVRKFFRKRSLQNESLQKQEFLSERNQI